MTAQSGPMNGRSTLVSWRRKKRPATANILSEPRFTTLALREVVVFEVNVGSRGYCGVSSAQ